MRQTVLMLAGIVVAVLPWFVFGIVYNTMSYVAAATVFVALAVLSLVAAMFQRVVTVLEWATLGWAVMNLAVALIVGANTDSALVSDWMSTASYFVFALILFATILMRQPFTIVYAKRYRPQRIWDTPLFMHTNMVLTWGYVIGMLCAALFTGVATYGASNAGAGPEPGYSTFLFGVGSALPWIGIFTFQFLYLKAAREKYSRENAPAAAS